MREIRTYGSEGGEGESPSLPLSCVVPYGTVLWVPACAGTTVVVTHDQTLCNVAGEERKT